MTDKTASPLSSVGRRQRASKKESDSKKPAYPQASEMVIAALTNLKERGGSSLQAIMKNISAVYMTDAEKHAAFIKKYIKTAVASGELVQTKGKGALASFKLANNKLDAARPSEEGVKTTRSMKTTRSTVTKATPRKSTPRKVARKPPAERTAKNIGEKKKTAKGPAAKPPRAKRTAVKPAVKTPVKKQKTPTKRTTRTAGKKK